jgi:predicted porin
MKKKLVALAALSAIAGGAQAQSSVTLYGIVDVAVRYSTNQGPASDNGESLTSVIGGGMSQSRWGINVNEDLGSGLRALANMEQRFTTDNGALGAGGQQFQQSWVGIQSSSFGRLTFGRQYNVLFDVTTGTFATFKYSPYIDAYKPEVSVALGVRNDNMVKYVLTAGGFTGELQVSAGEGNDPGFGKSYGGMAKYTLGSFSFGGGYLEREGSNATTGQSDLKASSWVVGGAYTSGPIYASAGYAQSSFDQGTPVALFLIGSGADNVFSYTNSPAAGINVDTRTLWFLNLQYQMTPAFNIGAAYWNVEDEFYAPLSGKPSGDFFAIVGQYAFSKRTDAYIGLDYTDISGPISFRQNNGGVNNATDRTGFMVGLRHRF